MINKVVKKHGEYQSSPTLNANHLARTYGLTLSSVELDPRHGLWRRSERARTLRQASYESRFDYFTLFYDVFWSAPATEILAIGPPFPKPLMPERELGIVALPSGQVCPCRRFGNDHLLGQLAITAPTNTHSLMFSLADQHWVVAVQPNLSSLLAGGRALVTLSRNNRLEWIRDWAWFHAAEYGADTVVLFDNASIGYHAADVAAVLRTIPGLRHVLAIHQPAPYGDGIPPEGMPLQRGMLNVAWRRLLAAAQWMLNLDIDELLILGEGIEVADLLARPEPVVAFNRLNVTNATDGHNPVPPRHRHFWRLPPDVQPIAPKWLVEPERLPVAATLHTHRVQQASTWNCPLQQGFIAHMLPLGSGWKLDRPRTAAAQADQAVDHPLLRWRLERVFAHESPAMPRVLQPWSPAASEDADLMLREAERWLERERPAEAAPLIGRALALAPDAVNAWRLRQQLDEWRSLPERVRDSQARIDALTRKNPSWYLDRANDLARRNPKAALAITRQALTVGVFSEELLALHRSLGGDMPDARPSAPAPAVDPRPIRKPLGASARVREALYLESPYRDFPLDEHPPDRQGWGSTKPVFRTLIERLRPRRIIEVGSWKGASALHLGQLCRQLNISCTEILCVDTWLGSDEMWLDAHSNIYASLRIRHGYPRLFGTFLRNIIDAGLTDLVTPVPLPSTVAAHLLTALGVTAKLIYIDGAHDTDSVLQDLHAWWPLLEPGGILLGDDFQRRSVRLAAERWATTMGLGLIPADNKFYVVKE